MTIQRFLFGLCIMPLLLSGMPLSPLTPAALADTDKGSTTIQIAQSDTGTDKKKKQIEGGEEELGEDDC